MRRLGIGFLTVHGVAGVAAYVIGHGFTKGALFMFVGVLLHRFGTVDEFDLHGRGRELRLAGVLFAIGGLLLSALPGVTAFFGKSLLDGGALEVRYPWLPAEFVISSMLTGGAVLRAAARVFLGWGASERREDVQLRQPPEEDEERIERDVTPPLMLIVPATLLVGAVVVGTYPRARAGDRAGRRGLRRPAAYATWVLSGHPPHYPTVRRATSRRSTTCSRPRARSARSRSRRSRCSTPPRRRLPRGFEGPPRAALTAFRRLHSGHIGDYIAWSTAAAAMLGGASLILLT